MRTFLGNYLKEYMKNVYPLKEDCLIYCPKVQVLRDSESKAYIPLFLNQKREFEVDIISTVMIFNI
jgi:hypothetical protein